MTIADLTLYMLVSYFTNGEISFIPDGYMDAWPAIMKHFEAVKSHDLVVTYEAAYVSSKHAVAEVKAFEQVDTNANGYAK